MKPQKKSSEPQCGAHREKQRQRAELRRRIRGAGELDARPVVEEIAGYLRSAPKIRTVAAYAALPGEVDLRELLSDADFGHAVRWVFPKIEGERLRFFHVRDMDSEMAGGSFGIMEPRPGLEELEPEEVDLFLCPGLGFDRKGGRVGRGRGFYDRMLALARPDALKFGVCFPFQLLDEVATEAHDIGMSRVMAG